VPYPGLYILTLPVRLLGECSVLSLRLVNLIFGILTYLVICSILKHKKNSSLEALSCFLFPISFFYHFLYYTDSGSTFFVLLSYDLALKNRFAISSLVSSKLNRGCCLQHNVSAD
jgi:alpha-1,2-glucosyltransferase